MSQVLARMKVCETHGLRRFLYPLSAWFTFTSVQQLELALAKCCLVSDKGVVVPCQFLGNVGSSCHFAFAVSLAPYEECELRFIDDGLAAEVNDPLHLQALPDGGLLSEQHRFSLQIGRDACLQSVVYDGIAHLSRSMSISRNNLSAETIHTHSQRSNTQPITASGRSTYQYADGKSAEVKTTISACKSWASTQYQVKYPEANAQVTYTLPFNSSTSTLTCDFGVGGGIYGKLQAGTVKEIVWRTEFTGAGSVKWSLATDGRTDYMGEVASREAYLPQRWFHLIDSGKSLAVAITDVPDACRELTVTLNATGDITIAFTLGDTVTGPAAFGVCYHFLNDIPAIAAATNPQSILLPPTVEVLPDV